jgi:hypothetical protein
MADTSKKHGRNKIVCKAYKDAKTHEKNQLRRILRHCRRYNITALRGDLESAFSRIRAKLTNMEITTICRENPRNLVL